MHIAVEDPESFLRVNVKTHDHVKPHILFFRINIESVHLQRPVIIQHHLPHVILNSGSLRIPGIVGIDADAGQDNAGLLVDLGLHPAGQFIHLPHRHGVRKLHMYGTVVLVRTVIVEEQVVGTPHLRLLIQNPLDGHRDRAVRPDAQNVIQGLSHHLHAGLDDKSGDDRTDPGFQGNARGQEDQSRSQNRSRQNRIKGGIGTGGNQGTGVDLFSLRLDIAAQHQLHPDGDGDNQQRNRAVLRLLRVNNLFDRLYRRGNTGIEHNPGHQQGAQIFDSSMPEGVLSVRTPAGQLRSENRDN